MGTEKTFAADNGTGVNYSAVPIFSPSPIKTNASYVARIALEDNRVRELLRHGGRINATAGMINPGCPPTMAQPCYLPALIITYGPVTFAFEVDEQTGTVSHAYPYLADYPNQYVSNNTPNYYRSGRMTRFQFTMELLWSWHIIQRHSFTRRIGLKKNFNNRLCI